MIRNPKGAVDFFIHHHRYENIKTDLEQQYIYVLETDGNLYGTVTIKGNEITIKGNKITIKRGYKETAFQKINTDNGDVLCYDEMEKFLATGINCAAMVLFFFFHGEPLQQLLFLHSIYL